MIGREVRGGALHVDVCNVDRALHKHASAQLHNHCVLLQRNDKERERAIHHLELLRANLACAKLAHMQRIA